MADKYVNDRNNPDSLGRKLRVQSAPGLVSDAAKAVFFDADAAIAVSDADDTNAITGLAVKAGVVLPFVPEKVSSFGVATKMFWVL